MISKFILLLAAFVASAHCSTLKSLYSKKHHPSVNSHGLGIFDGNKTCIKDHPHIGAVMLSGSYWSQCTIVSEQWCCTTADCVKDVPESEIGILVGSDDAVKGTTFKAEKVVVHPKYDPNNFDFEYACVKIKGKFTWSDKVKAIKLPKKAAKPKTDMVVAGWGSTDDLGNPEDEPNTLLLQGNMTWMAKKECAKTYEPFGITWTDRMACAKNKGKTTLCTGDWADAFVNNGVFYGMFVAGATSGWCSSEAEALLLSDVYTVAGWIKKTTGAKYEDE